MQYVKGLKFDEEPDYNYMLSLFENISLKKDFEIFDNRFDWNTKAILLQNCLNFYSSISKNGQINIFETNGDISVPFYIKSEDYYNYVHKTYEKAPSFQFKDWKDFKKL